MSTTVPVPVKTLINLCVYSYVTIDDRKYRVFVTSLFIFYLMATNPLDTYLKGFILSYIEWLNRKEFS